MNLTTVVAQLEALSKNLEVAQTVRERVRIADRIYEALQDIEQRVEKFVVTEIGHSNGASGSRPIKTIDDAIATKKGRFAQLKLADAAKLLLKDHGVLHGKEIEKHLKSNGYQTTAKKFQSSMVVAFRRDGGFVNIGGNRWKLKDS